jgi:hypothetical protein
MGKDPDVIREEIEETRAQMTETVDALGYKADVKARVKDSIGDKKDAVLDKAGSIVSSVTGVVPDGEQLKDGAAGGARMVKSGAQKVGITKSNPVGLAVGGAAAGFLLGLLVPSTRVEDEKLGQVGDQVKEFAKETGHDALDRGKQVVSEAGEVAKQSVKESGREQGEEMASTLKDKVQEVASSGTPS